ncbi:hypothetical protein AVEN_57042-1 [Araneus ventricosus]|uniref:Uncharacterized protein n=1 Tax=Araneus ventricosus TaxID=182803 RepID=A0A4Y2N3I3_ARAVE|nr:hypothetical protein AVEN_57042-1 [Araneus ventricosus]
MPKISIKKKNIPKNIVQYFFQNVTNFIISPREQSRSAKTGVCASARRITYATGNVCKKSDERNRRVLQDLHVSLGPPAAADVGEAQCQFSAADRFYVGAGTCASSNCSLYTTNGMLQTSLKPSTRIGVSASSLRKQVPNVITS